MPSPAEDEFNDLVLKEAVRKCWACDCAPAYLKNQIADLLSSGDKPRLSPRGISWIIWTAALAATLLLSFGLFEHFHTASALAALPPLPATLTTELIKTHEFCCKEANHQHLHVSKSDDVAIADALHTQLHRPMLVCRPDDDAWSFRGAAICKVGATPAGHLVFAKGDDRLSLFSLPLSSSPQAAEGSEYALMVDQHCIVGFVKNAALFCLVESGPASTISIDQLKQLQSQMQPAVAMIQSPRTPRVELTELLQATRP